MRRRPVSRRPASALRRRRVWCRLPAKEACNACNSKEVRQLLSVAGVAGI